MSIPVRRLKLMAFGFGAGVAGLVGCIFASAQTGAFPGDYDVGLLITIYAIMILGGLGSLEGIVLAALIVNGVPELLRNPDNGRWVFYGAIIIVLFFVIRPLWQLAAVFAGRVAFGFVVHGIADVVWDRGTAGTPQGSGRLGRAAAPLGAAAAEPDADRELVLHRADRGDHRRDAPQGHAGAWSRSSRRSTWPRSSGRTCSSSPEHHRADATAAARRDARRADERAAAGAVRHAARGDRVSATASPGACSN